MRTPPPGIAISSRDTVVWRPRPSLTRTSLVAWRSVPRSALTRVDLPDPDGPIKTAVRLSRMSSASGAIPSPVSALVTTTSTPERDVLRVRARGLGILGEIRLRQHEHRYGPPNPTRATARARCVADWAPRRSDGRRTRCRRWRRAPARRTVPPESPRTIALVRSSTNSTKVTSRSSGASSATQSPTAGRSRGPSADLARRVEGFARTSPRSVATSTLPRSARMTRPGSSPRETCSPNSASQRGV